MANQKSWVDQFQKSLKKLQVNKGYGDDLTESLEGRFQSFFEPETEEDELINFFFKAYINQSFEPIFNVIIEETFSYCESPIEKMMFVALTLCGRERFDEVILKHESKKFTDIREGIDKFVIECQHEIGNYRVDFLVSLISNLPVDDPERDGYKIIEIKNDIIVECDGHDFHEKTKEQAKRDKKRDRSLIDLGFNVYRFTGSEIWENPFDCAWQVIENLRQKNLENYRAAH